MSWSRNWHRSAASEDENLIIIINHFWPVSKAGLPSPRECEYTPFHLVNETAGHCTLLSVNLILCAISDWTIRKLLAGKTRSSQRGTSGSARTTPTEINWSWRQVKPVTTGKGAAFPARHRKVSFATRSRAAFEQKWGKETRGGGCKEFTFLFDFFFNGILPRYASEYDTFHRSLYGAAITEMIRYDANKGISLFELLKSSRGLIAWFPWRLSCNTVAIFFWLSGHGSEWISTNWFRSKCKCAMKNSWNQIGSFHMNGLLKASRTAKPKCCKASKWKS